MAAPSHRVTTSDNGSSSTTSHAIPVPGTAQEGDLMILCFQFNPGSIITPAAGWNRSLDISTGLGSAYLYWRVVTSSEPSSHTFLSSTSNRLSYVLSVFSGVDTEAPIDQCDIFSTSNTSSHPCPSVTSGIDEAIVFRAIFAKDEVEIPSAPAGVTVLGTAQNTSPSRNQIVRVAVDNAGIDSGDSSGTATFTTALNRNFIEVSLAIAPPRSEARSVLSVASTSVPGESTGATYSIPAPSGTTTGSLLIAILEIDPNPNAVTPPSGWSESLFDEFSNRQLWIGYRIVEEEDPDPYTWTFNVSDTATGAILRLEGAVGSPIVLLEDSNGFANSEMPSVTTPAGVFGFLYVAAMADDGTISSSPESSGSAVVRITNTAEDAAVDIYLAKVPATEAGATIARGNSAYSTEIASNWTVTIAIQEPFRNVVVMPGSAGVVCSSAAPSVMLGSLALSPDPAAAFVAAVDPDVQFQTVIAGLAASVVASANDPSIVEQLVITPSDATVVASGHLSQVVLTSITIAPDEASAIAAVNGPTVLADNVQINPDAAGVFVATVPPNLVQTSFSVVPDPAEAVVETSYSKLKLAPPLRGDSEYRRRASEPEGIRFRRVN